MAAAVAPRRPGLDRLMSHSSSALDSASSSVASSPLIATPSSSMPVASSSVVNKAGSASRGLYQASRTLLERLARVPGFAELYLDEGAPYGPGELEDDHLPDPVSRVTSCLQLGSSLCFLFNTLRLRTQLEVNPDATRFNVQACKRAAAQFLINLPAQLPEEFPKDQMFMVTQLFSHDTTATVQVIWVVSRVVDLIERRGGLMEPLEPIEAAQVEKLDDRAKVCREILETERKYVQDLEVLQDYQRQLEREDVLSKDMIHAIFLNLNQLVDFQRRLLIGIESHAAQPAENQRFGHLFVSMEDAFSCYEPYCANFTAANDLVMQENQALMKLSHILDPNYELPTFLIKPVQRICKWPLLMQQLVKMTDQSWPFYEELVEGLEAVKRITDRVNETKRRADNELAVQELSRRVDDWKGHDIASFGNLLLEDTFTVLKGDSEREYKVYLFQRIVLCCKEAGLPGGKKGSKSNSILKKPAAKRRTSLQLKGRIFIANITQAVPVQRGPVHFLEIIWRGDSQDESFSLKCRTEEILKLWQRSVNQAVEENALLRRSRQQGSSGSSMASSARYMGRIASPLSQFPGTPMSEMSGPLSSSHSEFAPFGFSSAANSTSSLQGSVYYDGDAEDADGGADRTPVPSNSNGHSRRTPATQSLPPGSRQQHGGPSGGVLPRRATEDANSATIQEWRSGTPQYPMPSLPRGASIGSATSDGAPPSLRSSASSRGLRSKPSTEWGSANPANGFSHRYDERGLPISRNPSQASLPSSSAPGMHRSRSASSPHSYQGPNGVGSSSSSLPLGRSGSQQDDVPSVPPLNIHSRSNGGPHSNYAPSSRSQSRHDKRISASSMGTDRSSDSTGAGAYTSSPASTVPPSMGNNSSSTVRGGGGSGSNGYPQHGRSYSSAAPTTSAPAIRLKVHYGEDCFAIVVPANVSHAELIDKVARKLKTCSAPGFEESALRLRYLDEDQDRVVLRDEDDINLAVSMALNAARDSQQPPTLTLLAS